VDGVYLLITFIKVKIFVPVYVEDGLPFSPELTEPMANFYL
jgi:hypothetical protein